MDGHSYPLWPPWPASDFSSVQEGGVGRKALKQLLPESIFLLFPSLSGLEYQ